jgi:hypothetical protein
MEEGMTETPRPSSDVSKQDQLGCLRLSPEDIHALARQGFVVAEFRQRRGPYYKLRWRRGVRQCVRYLGSDPDRAQEVRAALEVLQAPHRIGRQIVRLMAEARKHLFHAKRSLRVSAAAQGSHYHGYTLRRAVAPPSQKEETAACHCEKDFSF